MVGSWTVVKVCEGLGSGKVGSCLLLRGVLGGRHGGARGPRKPDGGKGEGAQPCRALRADDDDDDGGGNGGGGS